MATLSYLFLILVAIVQAQSSKSTGASNDNKNVRFQTPDDDDVPSQLSGNNQKADYHLAMLKRSVDRIKRSWTKSHVTKRSTRARADGLILNSLASYCTHFKSDPDITKYLQKSYERAPLSSRDISGYTRYNPKKKSADNEPDVLPIRVHAERKHDKIWVIFEVAHSVTAIVSTTDPSNFKKVILKYPENSCSKIVSKARFELDATGDMCFLRKNLPEDVQIVFQFTSEKSHGHVIIANVDVCKFDKSRDKKYSLVTNRGIKSENIPIPNFKLKTQFQSDQNDFTYIRDDDDLKFDLTIVISSQMHFSIHLVLWDWNVRKTLLFTARIGLGPTIEYERTMNIDEDSEPPFTVDIVNTVEKGDDVKRVRLLVHLNTTSRNQTGHISFRTEQHLYGSGLPSPVIRTTDMERNVELKLPDPQASPDDDIYFTSNPKLLCEGNCTLQCHAIGQDISAIYIRRVKPMSRQVKAASYILPHTAYAILEVGAASDEVDGDYQCIVVDLHGQTKTHDLKLYTFLLTEVKSFEYGQEEPGSLPHVTCKVYGDEDVDIAITEIKAGGEETRIDKGLSYDKNVMYDENKNEFLVKLSIPWERFNKLRGFLHCKAHGERGADGAKINFNYFRNKMFPYINYSMDIDDLKNGTVRFVCKADGAQPMDMWIGVKTTESGYEELREKFQGVTKTMKIVGLKSFATYDVPICVYPSMIYKDDVALECAVTNSLATQKKEYSVWSYDRMDTSGC